MDDGIRRNEPDEDDYFATASELVVDWVNEDYACAGQRSQLTSNAMTTLARRIATLIESEVERVEERAEAGAFPHTKTAPAILPNGMPKRLWHRIPEEFVAQNRHLLCEGYEACLAHASLRRWASFTCRGCPCFQESGHVAA